MLKTKNAKAVFLIDLLASIVGSGLLALSIHAFTAPNHIAPGGVTGIATIINYLSSIPIGVLTLAINIPLIIIGFIFLGKKFMFKTIISIISFTLFMDYIFVNIPVYQGDVLLAGIFGGAIMGIGMGLMLVRNSSSGGMDITNRIIHKKVPHIKLGVIIFLSDIVVAIISAIVFKSFESAMYAMITLFISSKAIDAVVYGFSTGKLMYIITRKCDEISSEVISTLKRSATLIETKGAYSREQQVMIMCAVRQNEYVKVKRMVKNIDPDAFIIITTSNEVVGLGWQSE